MSANPNPGEATALGALTQQQKDALLEEILSDVLKLHKSVKDLSTIVVDTDERITNRVIELRHISMELAGQREAVYASISERARRSAQQAFREDLANALQRFETVLSGVPGAIVLGAQRRFSELIVVGIATGVLSSAATLLGFWFLRN